LDKHFEAHLVLTHLSLHVFRPLAKGQPARPGASACGDLVATVALNDLLAVRLGGDAAGDTTTGQAFTIQVPPPLSFSPPPAAQPMPIHAEFLQRPQRPVLGRRLRLGDFRGGDACRGPALGAGRLRRAQSFPRGFPWLISVPVVCPPHLGGGLERITRPSLPLRVF
jgi:hypothetical protein